MSEGVNFTSWDYSIFALNLMQTKACRW